MEQNQFENRKILGLTLAATGTVLSFSLVFPIVIESFGLLSENIELLLYSSLVIGLATGGGKKEKQTSRRTGKKAPKLFRMEALDKHLSQLRRFINEMESSG
jgi:hypothetical protein